MRRLLQAAAPFLILAATAPGQAPMHAPPAPPGQAGHPAAPAGSAQSLPAAARTQLSGSQPAPLQPRIEPSTQAYRARVELVSGQLTVFAENSSLDQILRDIAHATNMKVSGGVTDERVYGTYGPASPADVLSELLDGTGINVLLVADSEHTLRELILTPRQGGPTPPSLNASRDNPDDNLPPTPGDRRRGDFAPNRRFQRPEQFANPARPENGVQPGYGNQPQLPPQPAADPNQNQDMTNQQSPNGVKTPQEIYDELQKAQQMQQQTPQPPQ